MLQTTFSLHKSFFDSSEPSDLIPGRQGVAYRSTEPLDRDTEPLDRNTEPLDRNTEPLDRDTEPLDRNTEPLDRNTEPLDRNTEPLEDCQIIQWIQLKILKIDSSDQWFGS